MNLRKQVRQLYWYRHFGARRLIFSAGMPRSGSTLLFNIMRLVLERKYGPGLSTAWREEVSVMSTGRAYLIKTHTLNRTDILRAYRTVYSFRDIRDVMVSRLRMFNKEPDIGMVGYYIGQDVFARANANLVIKYELMISDLTRTVDEVASTLAIRVDAAKIIEKLPNPSETGGDGVTHEPVTLLHRNHATNTMRGEWRDVLSPELVEQIRENYAWWLEENGYEH